MKNPTKKNKRTDITENKANKERRSEERPVKELRIDKKYQSNNEE